MLVPRITRNEATHDAALTRTKYALRYNRWLLHTLLYMQIYVRRRVYEQNILYSPLLRSNDLNRP